MAYTNIAVIGAGGGLGKLLIHELIASTTPKFNVTAIARPNSSYEPPSALGANIKVVKQDLLDHSKMVTALRDNSVEAVVMTQGVDQQFEVVSKAIVEAAIAAGVKMVMPSDYGSEDTPTFVKVYTQKPLVRAFVEAKAAEGKIKYTLIKNGAFLDMPLNMAYGIDTSARKATFSDDGTQKFNATSMRSVAKAIVGVLRSPEQFSNRLIHIHDIYTSQREILEIVQSLEKEGAVGKGAESDSGGLKEWEIQEADMEELKTRSVAGLERGELTMQNMMGAVKAAVWGKEGAADWDVNDDSAAVGLEPKDLKTEIKRKLESGK